MASASAGCGSFISPLRNAASVTGLHVLQFQLVKKIDALPITRDYIGKREAELRMRESARKGLGAAAE